MRYLLPILAAFLVSCGSSSDADAPPAFADIAGDYEATITAATPTMAAANPVGDTSTDIVRADGTLIGPRNTFHLQRLAGGDLITEIITLSNGDTEQLSINAALTTATAYVYRSGAFYGSVTFSLVKHAGG